MKGDIRYKAYKMYHKNRWFRFNSGFFQFEYRIVGFEFGKRIIRSNKTIASFSIEIRNLSIIGPGVYHNMYDTIIGRPHNWARINFNNRLRMELLYTDHHKDLEFFGLNPDGFVLVSTIGRIKYV